ncbi:MAG: LamG-like jellyroll fold domain-containing protein [Planctomycetia bacterium]|nr:LamG-like jellyroll fold domain-containing protein [Planctomycetia bacterium]
MAINNEIPLEIYDLAQKYIDDCLTEGEAKILLPFLDRNVEFRQAFSENILADFILRERYNALRQIQSCTETRISRAKDPLWDAVVAETRFSSRTFENHSSIPLHVGKVQKRVTRFWPNLGQVASAGKTDQVQSRLTLPVIRWGSLALAILLLVVIMVVVVQRTLTPVDFPLPEATARIAQTVDAVWGENCPDFKRGQPLYSQALSLVSGLVRLEFKNGAQVVAEGPTDLVINDELNLFCNRGRMSAYAPPTAKGLRVTTPFADFIDYGTRFSVLVTDKGARLDVIEGRVQVKTDRNSPGVLSAGNGTEVNNRRTAFRVKVNADHYITTDFFEKQLNSFEQKEQTEKEEVERKIAQDEHLLAYLNFGQPSSISFKNKSIAGAVSIPEATRSHCAEASGILSGEKSLAFNNADDHIWLQMRTRTNSLTLVATIKVNELKPEGNLIFSNDNFLQESGSVLWQVLRDGRLQFHITPSGNGISAGYPSPVVITPSTMNVWLTVAVVADAERKEIRHYVDGKLTGRVPWPVPIPLQLGNSTIGNTNIISGGYRNAWFSGNIACFSIFNKAVSEEELTTLDNAL